MSETVGPLMVRRRLALAAVLLGVVMTSLDNTVVNVALPSISRAFHTGIAGSTWVVDAYLLSFATLLLTGGRLADTFGRRRVFLAGTALFTAASLATASAADAPVLIASRAFQGAGAALLTPPTLAIITDVFRTSRYAQLSRAGAGNGARRDRCGADDPAERHRAGRRTACKGRSRVRNLQHCQGNRWLRRRSSHERGRLVRPARRARRELTAGRILCCRLLPRHGRRRRTHTADGSARPLRIAAGTASGR